MTLRRYAKRLRSYVRRRTLVLHYHRVAQIPADPYRLCVTPDHFAQQMAVLRKKWNPISLGELTKRLRDRRVPRRSVLVTFDDGYADNLHNAKPILEQPRIPAVVFVVAGSVGTGREFWWDELESILLQPGTLPTELTFRVNGIETRLNFAPSAGVYSEEDYQAHRGWNYARAEPPTERHAMFIKLHHAIRPLPAQQQNDILERLRAESDSRPAARPANLPLSERELLELCDGDLVEIGAHTMSHAVLSALAGDHQRREVIESRTRLQEILNRRITGFAYPYGTDGDFTQETVDIVRDAGFELAFTTAKGLVREACDTFRLPRYWVPDCDGDEFEALLQRWT